MFQDCGRRRRRETRRSLPLSLPLTETHACTGAHIGRQGRFFFDIDAYVSGGDSFLAVKLLEEAARRLKSACHVDLKLENKEECVRVFVRERCDSAG